MSSFTGVSVIADGKRLSTMSVDAGTDSGYHLLMVKDYSRTVQEIPNGQGIGVGPFMVGRHKWRLAYCPNGDPNFPDFVSLHLWLSVGHDVIEEDVKVHCKFSFVDEVEHQKPMCIRATEPRIFTSEACAWRCEKFVKRDVLERSAHLKDDCFTIRCDIMVCNDLNTQQDAVGTLSDIGQHFKILLQDKVGLDVTFEVGSELFPAHRCVLAARSKVFKAQLFGPMTEGITSSVIQIKDMEPKVFAALLSFIYTDLFPDMEEEEAEDDVMCLQWLQDLFVAADRYDIQQLKFLCETNLSKHIGVRSVASTLALAEQHHCHRLKEACLKFIQVHSPKHLGEIMATDGWEQITTTYPSVLNELIAMLASNQKEDKKRKR